MSGNGKVIQTKDIHKVYKLGDVDVHALRGVSLDIEEGEVAVYHPDLKTYIKFMKNGKIT